MFGNHGLCGLLEEGAHEKSPKRLGGNLGDFGEFCKGLRLSLFYQYLIGGNLRLWQKRFWEHTIRDEADFACHFDYLHFNPVKHGYVGQISDWRFSTFNRYVKQGIYPHNWSGGNADFSIEYD